MLSQVTRSEGILRNLRVLTVATGKLNKQNDRDECMIATVRNILHRNVFYSFYICLLESKSITVKILSSFDILEMNSFQFKEKPF